MTLEQEISQMAGELQHESVVQRRAAVRTAAALLATPRCQAGCRAQIIELLRNQLAVESYPTVRNDIQTILANVWDGVDPTLRQDDRQHMIGVTCPDKHVSYFDKRKLCSGESIIRRIFERKDGQEVEMFYVACKTPGCTHQMKIQLECGEYGR